MKLWKKVLIIVICLIILYSGLLFWGVGPKRTDVFLSDYEVLQEGKRLKLKIAVSSSMGYVKDCHVKQEGQHQYVTFYETFGLNNAIHSKNEFELEVEPDCQEIYFYKGDDRYDLVLQKNAQNQWEKPTKQEERI